MTRARRITTGVGALLALALIVVGVPVILIRSGAFPSTIPDLGGIWQALITPDRSGRAVFVVLAVLAWACWATFTLSIVREVAAAIRSRGRRPARPARGLSWSGRPAAVLVGAVVAMIVAAPVATMAAPPVAAAPTPTATAMHTRPAAHTRPAVPSPYPDPTRDTTATPDSPTTPTTATATANETGTGQGTGTRSYTVVRHDTLWSIAARQLGQPRRWVQIADLNPQIGPDHVIHAGQVLTLPGTDPQPPATVTVHRGDTLSGIAAQQGHRPWQEVWAANAGREEPGEDRFTNPDHIEPGWTITIPASPSATPGGAAPPVSPAAPLAGAGAQVSPGAAGAGPAPSTVPPPTQQPAPQPAAPTVDAAPPTGAGSSAQGSAAQTSPPSSGVAAGVEQDQQGRRGATVVGLFAAGGLVLGASAWVALVIARRQRFRHRVPGRGFAAAAPQVAAVERAVSSVGTPAVDDLMRVDEVLRRLAASNVPHLALAAVAVTGARITVHFTDPVTLPGSWTPATDDLDQVGDPSGLGQGPPSAVAWTFPADAQTATAGPDPADMAGVAPFPTLVTLGTDGNSTWLLDLERAGGLTLTGDAQDCLAVGRVVAAQLGLNPWSDGATVTLVGFGHRLVDLNPERLRYASCAQAPQVMAAAAAHAASAVRYASHGEGRDVPTIRRDDTEPEAWPPHVLLVAAGAAHTAHGLLELIGSHPARTATAVLITGADTTDVDAAGGAGLVAVVAADGTLTLAGVGLSLTAHRWDEDTADGVARLLRHARDADSAPIPPAGGPDEWTGLADLAGAIRADLVASRDTPVVGEADPDADTCLLPLADQAYVEAAATTVEDLAVLAPTVPAQVSDAVHDIDPGLDADLAAWFDPACPRPRLTLLGPLTIGTPDEGGRRRLAYYTEVIAYLATRDNGATVEQLADAFSIANSTARKYVHVIRHLLGRNPDTGKLYLPDADESPAGKARGVPTYQIRGILVDADLFRRLRLRGQARGQDGITDLAAALQLVTGEPFSQMRPGGGEWVIEGDRIDHHLTHAVTDVAHLVTTHALAAGDLAAARAATDIARVAAPYEEITRLDAIAIDTASGDPAGARRTLIDDVCNRSDDHGAPLELSERTQRILTQHADWLTRAS